MVSPHLCFYISYFIIYHIRPFRIVLAVKLWSVRSVKLLIYKNKNAIDNQSFSDYPWRFSFYITFSICLVQDIKGKKQLFYSFYIGNKIPCFYPVFCRIFPFIFETSIKFEQVCFPFISETEDSSFPFISEISDFI